MSEIHDFITRHEGKRLLPYMDTVGKMTIGVGRNLTDRGINDDECTMLLDNDIKLVIRELTNTLPWWQNLDWVRKMAMIDLGFNLGVTTGNPPKLLTFKQTLLLIENGKYADAADNLLHTKWADQVGKAVGQRAWRVTEMLRTGDMPVEG